MRVLFISPRSTGMGTEEENQRSARRWANLKNINAITDLKSCPNSGLLTIAATTEDSFDEMVYVDEEVQSIPWDRHFDLVAVSFMTQQATRAYELCKIFKDKGSYLAAGGIHTTVATEEALCYFDTVLVGEGEKIWPEFVKDFSQNKAKRVYVNTADVEMSSISVPKYDLLDVSLYKTIPVQISRGCPHDCEFCTATKVYGPRYRHKRVEQVLEEIEAIKKLKSNPCIYIADDNIQFKRPFVKELLSEFTGGGFTWTGFCDISIANDEDTLKRILKSGCRRLSIGFESIVPESLEKLEKWKFKQLDSYKEAIRIIQSHGIGLYGFFIVGLDGDDKTVFQRVVDFILENNLYGALISVPTPFPGSRLYERLRDEGRILSTHWGSYDFYNVVFEPAKMTAAELQDGFEYTLQQIYSEQAVMKRMEYFKKVYSDLRVKKA